jgi:hypothetical protein
MGVGACVWVGWLVGLSGRTDLGARGVETYSTPRHPNRLTCSNKPASHRVRKRATHYPNLRPATGYPHLSHQSILNPVPVSFSPTLSGGGHDEIC